MKAQILLEIDQVNIASVSQGDCLYPPPLYKLRKGAIERTQFFANTYANGFVWRADIKKFFDSVNQDVLLKCIERRIADPPALQIIKEIISSYRVSKVENLGKVVGLRERERKRSALPT